MDNYTKMMDAALKQGLIEWEPKVGGRGYELLRQVERLKPKGAQSRRA